MNKESILCNKIATFVEEDPANYWYDELRFFDTPLIGFARANDPLFNEMKKAEIGGGFFLTPDQWLKSAVSVVSYFLPFTEEVCRSNRAKDDPSVNWLFARFEGERLNNRLREFIKKELEASGKRAVAPLLEKDFSIDHALLCSNWSERHVAYVAGLGTFGLNRGLITAKGIAGRFGSVITEEEFTPLPRAYSSPFQYCLWLREGLCGSCIKRCPSEAISEGGMNKNICRQYLHQEDSLRYLRIKHCYPYSGCGKCQVHVPCESRIPQAG